ncbi:StAR-related lipid transfer protein 3 [Trichinella pseudospiralis]|uniref:StAR-related lipid transfer protein 3 n=2 Tax=Trichinella pseudospiralis TaxID=6337 RepID=A0A0V1F1H4_TRIPS|nr:StAR-related lipid transfer protein 3 [Trichinella pseudospiralis]
MAANATSESTYIAYELIDKPFPGLLTKHRRRLIIFTCFDFCLIFLLWILFVMTKSIHWKEEMMRQINFTNGRFFYNSLFDLVILSTFRCGALTICYACLKLNHWMPVAVSTGVTTLFDIPKATIYFSQRHAGYPLEFAIVVCSLLVAYIEVYLYDSKTRSLISVCNSQGRASNAMPERCHEQSASAYITAAELTTDNESDNGASFLQKSKYDTTGLVESPEWYIGKAERALNHGKYWRSQLCSWKKVGHSPLLLTHVDQLYGKVLYVKQIFPVQLKQLFSVLYSQAETCPMWHKEVLKYKVICKLNDNVDITYSLSAPSLRGYIASREFVDVRTVELDDDCITIGSISVPYGTVADGTSHIRGESGPNVAFLTAIDENSTLFEWFFNTDLKGNLPRSLVQRSLVSFMVNFIKNLENHLKATYG